MDSLRVAALQFATGVDVADNLDTCLRLIDTAAAGGAQLMVLPEFCNHLSWYRDAVHAWSVALAEDGPFLRAIADRARRHRAHVVINVSLRREDEALSVSSLLFGPEGSCLQIADKQTLMGHENEWFRRARQRSPALATPLGCLGLFACRDGVTFETARMLALEGADILCDSLNSFALDEASLHVPARAVDNGVFVVAANKVGPLIPADELASVAAATGIPESLLYGAGESQVVAPDGRVLARGPRQGEAVVIADIPLATAGGKRWGRGVELLASRRPALYRGLGRAEPHRVSEAVPETLAVACLAPPLPPPPEDPPPGWLAALPRDTRLAVLPECWGLPSLLLQQLASGTADRNEVAGRSRELVQRMRAWCAQSPGLYLMLSLPWPLREGFSLTALLVDEGGVVAQQSQLHASPAAPWSLLGEELELARLPWASLAMLVASDSRYPELVKLAALQGAHLLAVPLGTIEPADTRLALPSRAAENRLCVIASGRGGEEGLIADLETDFTLMQPWASRVFDGYINSPRLTAQRGEVTAARLHLRAAANKLMSAQTDLLADRPWALCDPLWSEGVPTGCEEEARVAG